jgi:hypothetical protein
MKKSALGILVAVASITLLSPVMVPLRSHLSIATTAVVVVIPVVVGVVMRRKLNDAWGEILQSDPSVGYRLVAPNVLQRPDVLDARPQGQS